ncbi:MAG: hypothetical protein ACI8UO_002712 [Verrucomicrobiales bacterium]|jgi:hypothetical protein
MEEKYLKTLLAGADCAAIFRWLFGGIVRTGKRLLNSVKRFLWSPHQAYISGSQVLLLAHDPENKRKICYARQFNNRRILPLRTTVTRVSETQLTALASSHLSQPGDWEPTAPLFGPEIDFEVSADEPCTLGLVRPEPRKAPLPEFQPAPVFFRFVLSRKTAATSPQDALAEFQKLLTEGVPLDDPRLAALAGTAQVGGLQSWLDRWRENETELQWSWSSPRTTKISRLPERAIVLPNSEELDRFGKTELAA